MINKVILIGNLGADPETRTTAGGLTVANLRLATSERIKRDGEWVDHTEWFRVSVFGTTAENVARYCHKGKSLYVEGKLRTREYTDKDGNRRWSTEVVADVVKFLGGKSDERGSSGGNSAPGSGGGGWGGADDEVPF